MMTNKQILLMSIPRDRSKTIDQLIEDEINKLKEIFIIHEFKRTSKRLKNNMIEVEIKFSLK